MRIAIMQPYLFPYLGYFQLISSVDKFIFYDDVSFINRGWINRNRLLIGGAPRYFTIPLVHASQWKKINTIQTDDATDWRRKLASTLKQGYARAPSVHEAYADMLGAFERPSALIADIAKTSVRSVCERLNIDTCFVQSSSEYGNAELRGVERILDICRIERAKTYVNLPGGKSLYGRDEFKRRGVELRFLSPDLTPYQQSANHFVAGLSVLDCIANLGARAEDYAKRGELE
jgi:hypothetical protein